MMSHEYLFVYALSLARLRAIASNLARQGSMIIRLNNGDLLENFRINYEEVGLRSKGCANLGN